MLCKFFKLFLFLPFLFTQNSGCEISNVTSFPYSTTDGLVIAKTAYIITFNVFCKDSSKPDAMTLFADLGNNKILPVIRSNDGNNFQISWTQEMSKSSTSNFEINIYNEEGLSQLKRFQRKENKGVVEPLFKLRLTHPGTYRGPWFQTEFIATVIFVIVWWFADSYRSSIMCKTS